MWYSKIHNAKFYHLSEILKYVRELIDAVKIKTNIELQPEQMLPTGAKTSILPT